MKNDKVDELEAMAAQIVDALPSLLVVGPDGVLLEPTPEGSPSTAPVSPVDPVIHIGAIAKARALGVEMHNILHRYERVTRGSKGGGNADADS